MPTIDRGLPKRWRRCFLSESLHAESLAFSRSPAGMSAAHQTLRRNSAVNRPPRNAGCREAVGTAVGTLAGTAVGKEVAGSGGWDGGRGAWNSVTHSLGDTPACLYLLHGVTTENNLHPRTCMRNVAVPNLYCS